ncbi:MAG: hypothetical protein LUD68_04420 [Rikenellaceae bacterium]|nr:hypothetical protein [Rikenellaceae bacterium]
MTPEQFEELGKLLMLVQENPEKYNAMLEAKLKTMFGDQYERIASNLEANSLKDEAMARKLNFSSLSPQERENLYSRLSYKLNILTGDAAFSPITRYNSAEDKQEEDK